MSFRLRWPRRTQGRTESIYVVCAGGGVDQVFACREDADRFASQTPDARVTRHQIRRSVDDATVIFDRRVVITDGTTVLDQTSVHRRFVDDPIDTPDPADVEWFHDTKDSSWHIAGFGMDKAALDEKMQDAIDLVCRLRYPAPIGTIR